MQEELLERQYVFRQYAPAKDLLPLSQLLASVEDYDHDGEDASETALREQLTWPNHKPEQDCWVIEAPDSSHELIGYCSVFAQTPQRCTLYAVVHPDFRRRGLGRALLTKAQNRARKVGADHVTLYANAQNTATNAFLRGQQFQFAGSAWVLHAPATLALEEAAWPAGYTVRSYAEVQQIGVLLEVMNGSYADRWGHAENERAIDEVVVQQWLANSDPGGIFLVFAPDGRVAGFCRAIRTLLPQESEASDDPLTDEIEQPGVMPEHRQRTLYHSLVVTALSWLGTRERHAVLLQSWGDDEQTIAIYQEMGFLLMQRFLAYQYTFHEC
jgi:mycothiol synthase